MADGTTTVSAPAGSICTPPRTAAAAVPSPRRGRAASLPKPEILGVLTVLDPPGRERTAQTLRAAEVVLDWLSTHSGADWQERWKAAAADQGTDWLDGLVADRAPRWALIRGTGRLVLAGVVCPTYEFLAALNPAQALKRVREVVTPELFARLPEAAAELGMEGRHRDGAVRAITKIVAHTGRGAHEITAEDLHAYRAWNWDRKGREYYDVRAAWDLLRKVGVIEDVELNHPQRLGQLTPEELVDRYAIRSREIRAVIVRYLHERRTAVDYSTLRINAYYLAELFWADIERHCPDQTSLRLSREDATAWRERVRFRKTRPGKPPKERREVHAILNAVRGFYLDLQEWAHEDPFWVKWAAPSPVTPRDLAGWEKRKALVTAEMHQRVRDRLPRLVDLAEAADRYRVEQAELLAAAAKVAEGETVSVGTRTYRRAQSRERERETLSDRLWLEDVDTGDRVEVRRTEDDAFWSWAIVETLQHTGIRIEELCELTQLALVAYRIPKSGETVPMLQIVPSKSNKERLQLVKPELANVLASVIGRLRERNGGTVPLVARYDRHEKTVGPALPHLFQRRWGWTNRCISGATVGKLLSATAARAGVTDSTGQLLNYTAHDFRRMFATELVTGGLPIHIAAKILGHENVATTQHYTAVFPEEIVSNYRDFLAARRRVRPEAEYREPTGEEWQEFQRHFELRRVALGTCGRAYGTACIHEHACVKCPMLELDPREVPRLLKLVENLEDRLAEAQAYGWGGEIEYLTGVLDKAREKVAVVRRDAARSGTNIRDLGIPTIRTESTGA